ncbi:MAG: hypothetical protein AUJ49_01370 [Desulfovibrionaceae bacterium CG1_02_65_16]|nr:MAG: hypothetical protein AUJ49_01370 [Desulfovibrionaceae bacterium CG1_02_65_16]
MNRLHFGAWLLWPGLLALALTLTVAVVCSAPLPVLAAEGENVGHVSRVKGVAYALHGGALLALTPGLPVRRLDVLKVGPGARVEVTMLDETHLILGPDTVLAMERYDLGRQNGQGAVRLLLTKGSFRVLTGQLSALRGGPFEILTPLATIGLSGAGGVDVWGGFLAPEELGVLHLSGSGVYVKNDGGRCNVARTFEGVRLTSPTAPPPEPTLWSPERRAQALRSVAFD